MCQRSLKLSTFFKNGADWIGGGKTPGCSVFIGLELDFNRYLCHNIFNTQKTISTVSGPKTNQMMIDLVSR
jgi:hypothetical protein